MWWRLIWGSLLLLLSGSFVLFNVAKGVHDPQILHVHQVEFVALGFAALIVAVVGAGVLIRRKQVLDEFLSPEDDPWERVRLVFGILVLVPTFLFTAVNASIAIDPPIPIRPSASLSPQLAQHKVFDEPRVRFCPDDNVSYAMLRTASIEVDCEISFDAILGLYSVRDASATVDGTSIVSSSPAITAPLDRGKIYCVIHAPWESCRIESVSVSIRGSIRSRQIRERAPARGSVRLEVEYARHLGGSRYAVSRARIKSDFTLTIFDESDPNWRLLQAWRRYNDDEALRKSNLPYTREGGFAGYVEAFWYLLLGALLVLWPRRR